MSKKPTQAKTGFARLLELAMMKKPLVIGSLVLSAFYISPCSIRFTEYLLYEFQAV
jgi:hypothetical protein